MSGVRIDSTWVIVILSFTGVVAIPAMVFLIRGAVKWSHVEDKLETVAAELGKIAETARAEKIELIQMMTVNQRQSDEVHKALDDRLRFMEQFWMGKGLTGFGPQQGERRP